MSNDVSRLILTDDDMKTLLNYKVAAQDIEMHRINYETQVASGKVDLQTTFHYAWCMTHSQNPADLKRASVLFQEIFQEGTEELKRDSLFYLALSETKQKYCHQTSLRDDTSLDCLLFKYNRMDLTALDNTSIFNYVTAKKYIQAFLTVEPNNVQAAQLCSYIEKRLKKDGITGMALFGAAAVFGGATAIVVGTLAVSAALGFALKRKK